MRASQHRRHRHAGPADQCRSDREQSREHEHDRPTSASAPNSRICSTRTSSGPGSPRPIPARSCRSGIQIGVGVRTAAIYRLTEQGNLAQTGNPYDLAINGSGYFQSRCPTARTPTPAPAPSRCRPTARSSPTKGYRGRARRSPFRQDAIAVTINADGQVQAHDRRPERAADTRPARARALSNRRRLAGHRRQSVHGDRRPRVAALTGTPGSPASARCSRAISKPPTSTRCRRSPI